MSIPISIKDALAFAQRSLPRLESRMLLAAVLQEPRTYLITHDQEVLPHDLWQRYCAWVTRAENGEPIPYILGNAPFYGRDFIVSPAVLIPRPETEQMVDEILTFCHQRPLARLIDVGTGSGCIAVTVAAELGNGLSDVWGVDISTEALAIAKRNSEKHQVDIDFRNSDLLTEVKGDFDIIVANLPYVTTAEFAVLDRSVREYEPGLALLGGDDGLDLVDRLLAQARGVIMPQGLILLEIGWQQGKATVELARPYFPTANISCLPDFAGRDRLVKIELQ